MKPRHLPMVIAIISIGVLFGTLTCFKTGAQYFGQSTSLDAWEGDHYTITTCALYQLAITYLQHVHHLKHLEGNVEANNGSCRDLQTIITTELVKFNYNPTSFRLARQEITMANIVTDLRYVFVPFAHFIDEEFERSSIFVMMQLRAAQSSLARREWVHARMAIGAVLHSVQDFYSHSNWIELGLSEPNRDIATGRSLGSIAEKTTSTCKSCSSFDEHCLRNNLIVDRQLTSGYYSNRYPFITPSGKCNHGFACSFSDEEDIFCDGISKDSPRYAHGYLHHQAASIAYNASVKVLNELWTSTDTDAFGKLLGLSNSFSLVFVIDVSNRLQSLVNMVRVVASELVNMAQDLVIKPSNYILSPFNGSHWGPIHIVTEAIDFFNLIEALNENDLQNPSPRYYDVLNEALKVCESDSLVFLFTDAPAHKPCSQGLTRGLARVKQTKIDILFANSSQSTTETINELMHFADATGGLFMNVNIAQPNAIGKFLFHRLEETVGYECILFESMSNRRRGTFMIDPTATSLRINVVSSSPSFVFYLINPMGSTFRPTSSSKGDYLQQFTIDVTNESNIGQWTYNCSEDCAIEVNVKSEFRCRTQLHASFSDKSFTLVATPPLIDQSDVLAITTCDNSNEAFNNSIQLIGTNGEILTNYLTTTGFVIQIEVPSESFRIRTCTGRQDGTFTYREERTVIDTSRIVMAINDQPLVAISNESLNVTYTIRNDAAQPLFIQLDVDDVLTTPKWYSIDEMSTRDDFIIIDTSRYTLINEQVRLVPLVFALQAFKNKTTIASDRILFRHEQIVPLYVQSTAIHLEAPTHLLDTI